MAENDNRYPEGFDASCGFSTDVMCEANMLAASLTGERQWDVKCIAAHLVAYAQAQQPIAVEGWFLPRDSSSNPESPSQPPQQADTITITRTRLKHWRELVDINPADLAPRMDQVLNENKG